MLHNVTLAMLLGAAARGVPDDAGIGAQRGEDSSRRPHGDRAADQGATADDHTPDTTTDADELSPADQHALLGDGLEREGYGQWRGATGLLAVLLCVGVAAGGVYLGLGGMMDTMAVWVSVIAITLSFSCLVALLAVAQFHIFRLEQRVKGMEREIENLTFELRRQEAENSQLMRLMVGDHK